MDRRILLCTDLDRTVLPNGAEAESPGARPLFRTLVSRPEVSLAYVSGRSHGLILDAIEDYGLPMPDYAIGDVGTTIRERDGGAWRLWDLWHHAIMGDWKGWTSAELSLLFTDIEALTLQEEEKQAAFKLSYYYPTEVESSNLLRLMEERLADEDIHATLVFSVDDGRHVGLLDLLPASASKLDAIRFLMKQQGYGENEVVFSGDSGNDLSVLTSGLQAVLVRNASKTVREQAIREARENGVSDRLYLAEGGFMGLNGNYSAGVLEGVSHFIREAAEWLEEGMKGAHSPARRGGP